MGVPLTLALSLGDPSGIGPEIVAIALASLDAATRARLLVFGDRALVERGAAAAGVGLPGGVSFVEAGLDPAAALPGRPTAAGGAAQVAYLEAAVQAIRRGAVAGLVTAPISKAAVAAAGFGFPGHTEFLADRLAAPRVAMMLAGPRLRVVLATIHLPLAAVPGALTIEDLAATIGLAAEAARRDFGIARPRIGVLGLNPHAGEGGLIGVEERTIVAPAIARAAAALGPDAELEGPLVPDAAYRRPCDVFVALYHDQGLIPIKLLDFEEAVNLTLGLPIVRTSPDHGVAYDIAGRGVARATSLLAAIRMCAELTDRRRAVDRIP